MDPASALHLINRNPEHKPLPSLLAEVSMAPFDRMKAGLLINLAARGLARQWVVELGNGEFHDIHTLHL